MNDIKSLNYIEWLCYLVCEEDTKRADILDKIPYRWHFHMDENRANAGLVLRQRYEEEYGIYPDDIGVGPASVFEVLVALAFDFSLNADISEADAYHEMIRNMCIDDTAYKNIKPRVEDWMDGKLNVYGNGSPFPIYHYNGDVMHLNLWDQMNTYINERYPMDSSWID